jgi:hypothetical protein
VLWFGWEVRGRQGESTRQAGKLRKARPLLSGLGRIWPTTTSSRCGKGELPHPRTLFFAFDGGRAAEHRVCSKQAADPHVCSS